MAAALSDVTLIGADYSVYTRIVRIGLSEKKVAYTFREMDIFDEAEKRDHRPLHPFGKIPALIHGERTVIESAAILRYLECLSPQPSLFPGAPADLAIAEQTIEVVNSYAYPVLVWQVYVPWSRASQEERPAIDFTAVADETRACLAFFDKCLAGRTYFAGDRFGAGDAFVYPVVCYFRQVPWGEQLLASCNALQSWFGRVGDRPSVLATRFPVERASAQ